MRRPKKPKRRHQLREVVDPATVTATEQNNWLDPIGGQDPGGQWYIDRRLCGYGKRQAYS